VTTRVVVFGREPLPGRVKSRLAATIGGDRAAAVYAVLLDAALQAARAAGFETVLSLAEAPSAAWARSLKVGWELQSGADLGSRMATAFTAHFGGGAGRVVLVGSDCPGLRPHHMTAAAERLAEAPVVLGPSADGGYWMVAQRAPGVDLFAEIPWSVPTTLAATQQRLRKIGVQWSELGTLSDIDTEADLLAALDDDAVPESVRRRLRDVVRTLER
jgi:rSAM/selenodomain-associated transferase 1